MVNLVLTPPDGRFPLGRQAPTDRIHVERYALTRATLPTTPTPVVVGVDWHEAFENPTQRADGTWWFETRRANLGRILGGHAMCARPPSLEDAAGWHAFFDQNLGTTERMRNSCVGFSWARFAALLHRRRFDGFSIYGLAQEKYDEWDGTDYFGTSVRAGGDVMRHEGPALVKAAKVGKHDSRYGIAANGWALSVDQVMQILGDTSLPGLPLLQSWGEGFPREVFMDWGIADELLFRREGDATAAIDKPGPDRKPPQGG